MEAREFLAHLAARWRQIAACLLASLLIAGVYLALAPTEYLATASLLFDPNANGSLTADTGVTRAQPDPTSVENQVRLVISDDVLRRVVDREKLITDSEFGAQPSNLIQLILERLGLRQPRTSEDIVTATITNLREHIYTRRSERTFVIDVGVYAREAQKSARLTDALAQAFIEEGTAARITFARQQADEIRKKLAELKARIQEAETRVEQYKAEHNIFDSDGKTLTTQNITEAERDVAQAHLRTVDAKSRLDQLRAALNGGRDLASLPDALRSPAIERIKAQIADIIRQEANLRTTLGPRHPSLLESENQLRQARALLQAELRRLAEAARHDYDIATADEAALQKRLTEARAKASTTNEALVEMRELQREVELNQAIYDRFLKASGFVASDQLTTPTARIIAAAIIPTRAESPRRLVVLSIALATGLGLGLFLASLGGPRTRRPTAPTPRGTLPGAGARVAAAARALAQAAGRVRGARALGESGGETAAETASGEEMLAPIAPAGSSEEILAEAEPPEAAAPASRAPEEPARSAIFAEAELPDRFVIPRLAEPKDDDRSLTARVRAAREAPETLLPHLREVELNPGSEFSRIMRDLRRTLELRFETQPMVIAIVSEMRDCGKSTLAANLARAFVDGGSRVVILDADRRHASLTQAMATDAPEGRLRIAEGIRPVFALDGSWRSGVFLSSLALGRNGALGPARRSGATLPSFASVRALADVLIIDTQSGTLGPALGPDLSVDATLIVAPVEDGDNGSRQHSFADVELVAGTGRLSMRGSGRRENDGEQASLYSGPSSLRRRRA
jgi:uncharacterized protein involved in exopolysaccharide biosynthesis/Mrp family chromosome partitioning ATPase